MKDEGEKMKRFLIYFFSVLVPIVLILGIGEYLVRQVPNPYKYKEEWMEKHHGEVEILVFGASHTYYGIKPDLLGEKAFSLANNSQSLKYDYYLLNKFDCPNLKMIVLQVSYPTLFFGNLEDSFEWYRAINYKIYMDYPEHSDFSRYNFEFTNMEVFKAKLCKYFNPTEDVGFDKYGMGTAYKLSNKDSATWNEASAIVAVKSHTVKDGDWDTAMRNLKEKCGILDDIVSMYQKRDILMVMVTTPCWEEYVKLIDEHQWAIVKKVASDYSKRRNVFYFDYFKDNRFNSDDFYDSNHLSDVGAVKLTKILKDDIQKSIDAHQ